MAQHVLEGLDSIAEAIWFAAWKHRDQRRSDIYASPYLNHVIETWRVVVRRGRITDPTIQIAAILHDVLETGEASPDEIGKLFGSNVRLIVEELTVDPFLSQAARRAIQLDQAARLSDPARIIRLADKVSNLRTLRVDRTLAENRQYIDWADKVARVVKGINYRLDTGFDWMLRRARKLLRDAGREEWPPATVPEGRRRSKGEHAWKKLWPPRTAKMRPDNWRRHDQSVFRVLAEPGVRSLKIDWCTPDAIGRFDGWEIPLPPMRAHLLSILAFLKPPDTDGISPFLAKQEVRDELGQRTGHPCNRHSFDVAIDRLQDHLYKYGVNPLLVEEDAKCGVRFRYRQIAPELSAIEEPEELLTVP